MAEKVALSYLVRRSIIKFPLRCYYIYNILKRYAYDKCKLELGDVTLNVNRRWKRPLAVFEAGIDLIIVTFLRSARRFKLWWIQKFIEPMLLLSYVSSPPQILIVKFLKPPLVKLLLFQLLCGTKFCQYYRHASYPLNFLIYRFVVYHGPYHTYVCTYIHHDSL